MGAVNRSWSRPFFEFSQREQGQTDSYPLYRTWAVFFLTSSPPQFSPRQLPLPLVGSNKQVGDLEVQEGSARPMDSPAPPWGTLPQSSSWHERA